MFVARSLALLIPCSFVLCSSAGGAMQGDTATVEIQTVEALDASSFAQFGHAVDIDGTSMAVGAVREASQANSGGAVYIFDKTGADWAQSAKIVSPSPGIAERFGDSVALDGDTLAVSALGSVQAGPGEVHIFRRNGANWDLEQSLATSGANLELQGDELIVGVPTAFVPSPSFFEGEQAGAVNVFRRTGTSWAFAETLFSSAHTNHGRFGVSVDVEGDTLVVGALQSSNFTPEPGYVEVFNRVGTAWVFDQRIEGNLPGGELWFGTSIDLIGDELIVGNEGYDGLTVGGFLFERSGTTWSHTHTFPIPDLDVGGQCGRQVALVGDRALIVHSCDGDGRAFLYERNAGVWGGGLEIVGGDSNGSAQFGFDFDFDGTEIAFGVPFEGDVFAGVVLVHEIRATTYASFCSGDGGDQAGCTDCVCGNNAPPGTTGGCINGAGTSARLIATGDANEFADTLRFDMTGANPLTFGVLVSANNALPQMGPCPPGSGVVSPPIDGLRCVGGGLLRHGARGTGYGGRAKKPWGHGGNPAGGLIAQGGFAGGQTRNWQVFYREEAGLSCGTGQNTTDAVSVTFTP